MIAAKVILLFWTFYFTIIFITNLIDLFKHFKLIPNWWKLTSGNYNFLMKVTSAYKLSGNTLIPAFAIVILFELATAFYFWKVNMLLSDRIENMVYIPFTIGLILFGGFIILDEIFLSFTAEETHFRIFIALIVSMIFINNFIS